jgi:hypothetical protein
MKANVMDTIQGKLPSKQSRANVIDIIKGSIQKRKLGIPFETFLKILADKLQDKSNSIVQIDNTAFFIQRNPATPSKVNFAVFSIDNPNGLQRSVSGFHKFLKNQNIMFAETTDELKDVVNAFNNSGIRPKIGKTMERKGNKMAPAYKISFGLGEK